MIVWLNGAFMEEGACSIAVTDRGFTLADGVFDTMLAVDGTLVRAGDHARRLVHDAGVFRIPLTLDLDATARALLEKNGFGKGRYAVRTTVTRGPGVRGLAPPEIPAPTILMRASPAPEPGGPVTAIISGTVRRNERSPLSAVKSLNYGDNLLALMEAQDKGADDAILLNGAGKICCATSSTVFIVEGETIITPPLRDGVLNGITRGALVSERKVREDSIGVERLLKADAVFLTNSILGIRPVTRIGGRIFGAETGIPLDGLAA